MTSVAVLDKPVPNRKYNPYSIGIDIGISTSKCGVFENYKVDVIAFNGNNREIPNYVYYNPDSDEISVGQSVKSNSIKECNRIYDTQKFIGLSYFNRIVEEGMKEWPFKVINENGFPKIELQHNKNTIHLTATDITSEIVKYIKILADEYCGNSEECWTKAVITYPFHFTENQKIETKLACEKANIEVIELIPEAVAITIAYIYEYKGNGKENYLVYNFTKSRFDVTICNVDIDSKIIKVIGYDGLYMSGDDIDNILVDYYLQLYMKKTGRTKNEIENDVILSLQKACEKAKCSLSEDGSESFVVDYKLLKENHIDNTLTIIDFNRICKNIFKNAMNVVDKILKRCKLSPEQISNIILSGGSSRIPKVHELLQTKFGKSIIWEDINPEEACVYGTTIYANMEKFHFKIENDLH